MRRARRRPEARARQAHRTAQAPAFRIAGPAEVPEGKWPFGGKEPQRKEAEQRAGGNVDEMMLERRQYRTQPISTHQMSHAAAAMPRNRCRQMTPR